MGYFSNGSEGDSYEARYCSRCVHREGKDGRSGCHVMLAHILYSYKLCNSKCEGKEILDLLIPRDGAFNGECSMFHEGAAVETPDEKKSKLPTIMPAMRDWALKHGIEVA